MRFVLFLRNKGCDLLAEALPLILCHWTVFSPPVPLPRGSVQSPA